MNSMPRTPPHSAIREISTRDGAPSPHSLIHMNRAGRVKIAPAATDSPAEPMVCTILFSNMESLFNMTRMTPMDITAAGMDADTVMPTLRPRYALAAPNSTARSIPRIMDTPVISGTTLSAGINGLKPFSSFM